VGEIDLGNATGKEISAKEAIDMLAAKAGGVAEVHGERELAEREAADGGGGGLHAKGRGVGLDAVHRQRVAEVEMKAAGGLEAEDGGAGAGIENEGDGLAAYMRMDNYVAINEIKRDVARGDG